jgi:hypothetical protein
MLCAASRLPTLQRLIRAISSHSTESRLPRMSSVSVSARMARWKYVAARSYFITFVVKTIIMKTRFDKKAKIFDIVITAVGGTLSVGVML